jgi:hypothetical protein
MTARALITATLRSLRALGVGDELSAEDANDALDRLNDWLDGLALERLSIFYLLRTEKDLQVGKQQYTIGTGGEIDIVRPTHIDAAGLIFDTGATPHTEKPIDIYTDQRMGGVRQKLLESPYVQAIHYDFNWVGGLAKITLWPVPNVGHTRLVLYTPQALPEFATLDTDYTFPPGYRRFLRTNLMAEIAPEYGKQLTADQVTMARNSKANVKRTNVRPVESRVDAALLRGDFFDWRTGEPR